MFEKRSYERGNFSEWEILLPELSGRRFVECSFAAADFSELGRCVRCTFDRCDFTMARWNGVEIKDSAFLGCNFKFANFFATVFDHCKMTGSSFAEAESELMTIDGGDWSYTELWEIRFDRKQLRGIDFTGADLTGARFSNVGWRTVLFGRRSLTGSAFVGRILGTPLLKRWICYRSISAEWWWISDSASRLQRRPAQFIGDDGPQRRQRCGLFASRPY